MYSIRVYCTVYVRILYVIRLGTFEDIIIALTLMIMKSVSSSTMDTLYHFVSIVCM